MKDYMAQTGVNIQINRSGIDVTFKLDWYVSGDNWNKNQKANNSPLFYSIDSIFSYHFRLKRSQKKFSQFFFEQWIRTKHSNEMERHWQNFCMIFFFGRERENAFKWREFNISSKHNRKNQWNENAFRIRLMRWQRDSHFKWYLVWCYIRASSFEVDFDLFQHSSTYFFFLFYVYSSFNDVKSDHNNNNKKKKNPTYQSLYIKSLVYIHYFTLSPCSCS